MICTFKVQTCKTKTKMGSVLAVAPHPPHQQGALWVSVQSVVVGIIIQFGAVNRLRKCEGLLINVLISPKTYCLHWQTHGCGGRWWWSSGEPEQSRMWWCRRALIAASLCAVLLVAMLDILFSIPQSFATLRNCSVSISGKFLLSVSMTVSANEFGFHSPSMKCPVIPHNGGCQLRYSDLQL